MPKQTLRGCIFLIPPFFTLVLGSVLFELVAFNFPALNDVLITCLSGLKRGVSLEIRLNESKARLLWLTSVNVYFLICAGFASFIWHAFRHSALDGKLLVYIGFALLFSFTEMAYLIYMADSLTSPLLNIFGFTYNALVESKMYSSHELLVIKSTLNVINFVAINVTPFGIVAGCCIMQKSPDDSMTKLDLLRYQSRHLKDLLLGGSAVMVIGLVHMKLWLNWPLSFIVAVELRSQLEIITLTICQYWGVIYTLIMAALYMPAAIFLSEEARIVIMQGNDEEMKKNPGLWLSENKMLISPTGQLPQLVTILTPMLVGSFGSSLSNLVQF